jgi:hypothetical protein
MRTKIIPKSKFRLFTRRRRNTPALLERESKLRPVGRLENLDDGEPEGGETQTIFVFCRRFALL